MNNIVVKETHYFEAPNVPLVCTLDVDDAKTREELFTVVYDAHDFKVSMHTNRTKNQFIDDFNAVMSYVRNSVQFLGTTGQFVEVLGKPVWVTVVESVDLSNPFLVPINLKDYTEK